LNVLGGKQARYSLSYDYDVQKLVKI